MVDSDAEGCGVLLAYFQQRNECVAYTVYFGCIFLIRIVQLYECASGIGEVAGVDSYFFDFLGGCKCCAWVEVYIGYQRYGIATLSQSAFNHTHIARFPCALCGKAHNVSSGIGDGCTLRH